MIGATRSTGAATTDHVFGSFNNTATSHWGKSSFTKPTISATFFFGPQTPDLFVDANISTSQDGFGITCVLDFSQSQHEANFAPTSADKFNGLKISGQNSGFGAFKQTSATSVFGSGTATTFGQVGSTAIAVNPGTSVTKFQPFSDVDTLEPIGVNCKYYNITAMQEYEGKSLDELRMEDYLANRRGPQDTAVLGFGHPVLLQQSADEEIKNKELAKSTNSPFGQSATEGIGTKASQSLEATNFGSTKPANFRAPFNHFKPLGAKPAFGPTAMLPFGQTVGFDFNATAGQQKLSFSFGQPAAFENKSAFCFNQTSTANTGINDFGTTASTSRLIAKPTSETLSCTFQYHDYKMQIDFPLAANSAAKTGPLSSSIKNTATSFHLDQSTFRKPTISASLTFGPQQPQTSDLLEGVHTSTAFGNRTTTQPTFSTFSQHQQNPMIFGVSQTNPFSLFGQPASTSAFGSLVKPTSLGTFGQLKAQPSSLFTFGQTAPTTTSDYGSPTTSAFDQPTNAAAAVNSGTSIAKYQPTTGTDTIVSNRWSNIVNTKMQCITAMKKYEGKCLEELRMEDYLAKKKGPQAGASGCFGGFSATATKPSTGLLLQPAAEATADQGSSPKTFGETNAAADRANIFRDKATFGQILAPSAFGQTSSTCAASVFGQTASVKSLGKTDCKQPLSSFGKPAMTEKKPAFNFGQTSNFNTRFGAFGTSATTTGFGKESRFNTFSCTVRCDDYNIQVGFTLPAANSAYN